VLNELNGLKKENAILDKLMKINKKIMIFGKKGSLYKKEIVFEGENRKA